MKIRWNNFIYIGISLNKDCCQLKDSGEKNNSLSPNQGLEAWNAMQCQPADRSPLIEGFLVPEFVFSISLLAEIWRGLHPKIGLAGIQKNY